MGASGAPIAFNEAALVEAALIEATFIEATFIEATMSQGSWTQGSPAQGSALYRPCVGIMVLNEAGKVWQGRRCDSHDDPEGRGSWWQMPQGGIEPGEDIRSAAKRELFEETGMTSVVVIDETQGWHSYDLPPALVPEAWDRPYRGQRQKWIAMCFVGRDDEINIEPAAGLDLAAEFDAWRWVPMSELAETVVAFKRDVYEAVVREFAHLAEANAKAGP